MTTTDSSPQLLESVVVDSDGTDIGQVAQVRRRDHHRRGCHRRSVDRGTRRGRQGDRAGREGPLGTETITENEEVIQAVRKEQIEYDDSDTTTATNVGTVPAQPRR